jgi:hypothetical protein
MRVIGFVAAIALLGLASPVSAQMMCGPGQSTMSTPSSAGMMCGGMPKAEDDPMADKPKTPPQRTAMCPCCANMGMMRGHSMPMEPPKQ